jgi:pseudaminic acid synthase
LSSFEIAGHKVGDDAPVLIVAELSANHGNKLEVALRTIEAAAKAGADAIKLQTYTPDTLTLASSEPPFVVTTDNAWSGRTLHDLYAEAMTPWTWHAELMEAAKSHGLVCFSTPFDPTAVAFLEGLHVPCYKIASFELNDLPLVETVARTGKPVIMSTGMASLEDIERAVRVCRENGNERLALLRCVSCYPAQAEDVHLGSFERLRAFGAVLGLSDHTRDHTVAIASVALGAKIVEKHFIVDRSIGGPDAFFSLEPAEFHSLVDDIRRTEAALGAPRFGPSASERPSFAFRRSLFVTAPVRAGETLTADNVRSIHPGRGLAPRHLPEVLGRVAARDLTFASPLTWDMVGGLRPVPSVSLRPATRADSADLLAWRNDPLTRGMSISSGEVSNEEHEQWLERSLEVDDRRLFVAEYEGRLAGVVRLDLAAHATWEVSITVAPSERGRGLALAMLRSAEDAARGLGALRLLAVIRPGNKPSLKVFKAAGYYGFIDLEGNQVRLVQCTRRIVPFVT